MQEASPLPADHFPRLLARLPPGTDVEALAREKGAFQRARGVQNGTDLLRLALAWGSSGQSVQEVATWAGQQGIASLSEEALLKRLHKAGDFLEALAACLLSRVGSPRAWHGRVLRIADSTSLSKPASQGTDWRVHAVYDLGSARFSHLALTDGRGAEALDRGAAVAGEVRIADRGYANAPSWLRFAQSCASQSCPTRSCASQSCGEQPAGAGADFIVRMRWNTVRLSDLDGRRFDLALWLGSDPLGQDVREVTVRAHPGKRGTPMNVRLIARKKPPEAAEAAVQRLRRRASRNQTETDPRSLVAAGYVVLATSLPGKDFPAEDVLAVYRLRWQIELAFKRLKSLMGIDAIRTRTEAGTRCWLHAQLIVALLCEDFCQGLLESFPSGP